MKASLACGKVARSSVFDSEIFVMIDQTDLNEVFPNNPIREVAFEIRFPMNLRIMRDVCDLQVELARRYPNLGVEEIESPTAPTKTGYVFTDPEGGRIIKVWNDRLSIIFTQYKKFEVFKKEIEERSYRFCEMFGIKNLVRIGLRYINNIIISSEDRDFSLLQYVRPYLDFSCVESIQVPQFKIELLMHKEDCLLNARTGILVQTPSPQEAVYILDLDAFVGKQTTLPELAERLEKLHYYIQVEFLSHITDEYKQKMRNKK